MDSYEVSGRVTAGKMKLRDREGLERTVSRWPDCEILVTFRQYRPKRSDGQNRFWHGVVIPLFAEHCGHTFEEMKDILALELLPKEIQRMGGDTVIVPGHTSDLNTKEFNDLIERAQRLGASMDIYIPDPNEQAA